MHAQTVSPLSAITPLISPECTERGPETLEGRRGGRLEGGASSRVLLLPAPSSLDHLRHWPLVPPGVSHRSYKDRGWWAASR